MIQNKFITLEVCGNTLKVTNNQVNDSIEFNWPAVALGLNGKRVVPTTGEKIAVGAETLTQTFNSDGIDFTVSLKLTDKSWFTKSVDITSTDDLPTPDYLEVDCQRIDDQLKLCGYVATNQPIGQEQQSDEEATGQMPGCGYPLIGQKYFVGLEHPAAFNTIEDNQFTLRHYPCWENNKLERVDEVFGWGEDPTALFADYLDEIRIPPLKDPMVSYCTFWSDPYRGNNEYDVSYENYKSFFEAFKKLGLVPDVFTLDAGWQDRQSVFQSKADVGHDEGLNKLRELVQDLGAELSLWLSHNGRMGICPEFMKENGYEVGSGNAAAYCGEGYGVMMDKKFEKALEKRFCELIDVTKAIHFKIDWDNECATNEKFSEEFPTVNHVRQASLNAMFRINKAMRAVKKDIITRNGWWPSPWWLCHADHLWLCQSGDSEHAVLPSKTQRDSAATHRDLMYYNVLQRDKTALPLDCFDNHEFPDASRNPFMEEPISWTNAVWLTFMRGSTYLAYMLQPESFEEWQAESLKQITDFCREHSHNIFVNKGRMILGHPGKGEVYGFMQPREDQSWCILRNPLPIPQAIKVDGNSLADHNVASIQQFYPHYESFEPECEMTLLAHEVKVIILNEKSVTPLYEQPFMTQMNNGKYEHSFPSSLVLNDSVRPLVNEIYQLPELKFEEVEQKDNTIFCSVTSPYRLRDFEFQIKVASKDVDKLKLNVFNGRYPEAYNACYAAPVTEVPRNLPGFGESRNPDGIPEKGQRFFSIRMPEGGTTYVRLELEGIEIDEADIEIWATGFEAPSRNAISGSEAPFGFNNALPYQHPKGFGKALKLEL